MVAQIDREYARTRPTKVISRLISYAFFEGRPLTTKGRWINPFVFTHMALERRLPQLRRVEKPLFIVGTGRSGTTILGMIMSMHEDVGFLNEPKALWHSVYPHEDVNGNYSLAPAKYRLSAVDANDEVIKAAHKLFGFYLWTIRSNRVVDKFAEWIFRISFIRTIFPDAKFIFLVRNGWETCSSIDQWSKRKGVEQQADIHDWWGVNNRKWHYMLTELVEPDPLFAPIIESVRGLDRHLDMAAVEWIVTMREGVRAMANNPDFVHRIRYEDIVGQPEKTLGRLLDFCELRPDPALLAYAKAVLKPAPPHPQFDLEPAIRPLFESTLDLLGYN